MTRTSPFQSVGEPSRLAHLAGQLLEARRGGRTIDLLTQRWPDLDLTSAEKIAAETIALGGDPVVGIKLGFTSAAMRTQMSIASPNFGWLTAEMGLTGGTTHPRFVHPRIEPEVAVVLARPIGEALLAPGETICVIESVHAAFEIVDTRYHDYKFSLIDNTADNSSAAGFVLGPAHRPAGLIDRPLPVVLLQGGLPVARGSSRDAMGGPLAAVAWLAAELCGRGLVLPAGSIILTGGLTAAPYLRGGEPVSAKFADLGMIDFCL